MVDWVPTGSEAAFWQELSGGGRTPGKAIGPETIFSTIHGQQANIAARQAKPGQLTTSTTPGPNYPRTYIDPDTGNPLYAGFGNERALAERELAKQTMLGLSEKSQIVPLRATMYMGQDIVTDVLPIPYLLARTDGIDFLKNMLVAERGYSEKQALAILEEGPSAIAAALGGHDNELRVNVGEMVSSKIERQALEAMAGKRAVMLRGVPTMVSHLIGERTPGSLLADEELDQVNRFTGGTAQLEMTNVAEALAQLASLRTDRLSALAQIDHLTGRPRSYEIMAELSHHATNLHAEKLMGQIQDMAPVDQFAISAMRSLAAGFAGGAVSKARLEGWMEVATKLTGLLR